jgi:hypothetical protein
MVGLLLCAERFRKHFRRYVAIFEGLARGLVDELHDGWAEKLRVNLVEVVVVAGKYIAEGAAVIGR